MLIISFLFSHIASTANETVDLLIVIGNEKLTIEMKKLLEARGVTVMSLEKSSGVSFFHNAATPWRERER